MATTYKSTLQVRRWKTHTCSACEGVYAYVLARKAVGSARSKEKAQANMVKEVLRIEQRETDMQPCPGCGLYQPDMIAQRRVKVAIRVFWCVLAALVATVILRVTDLFRADQLAWLAAIICLAAALIQQFFQTNNPNRDLESNRRRAAERVAAGQVKFTPPPKKMRAGEIVSSPLVPVALVLLFVAAALAAMPEIVRSVRGWPLNVECYPPVVGAADQTRFYMPGEITSIKSYWRGKPTATLTYDGAPEGATSIRSQTNQNDWGSTIEAKSDEQNSHSHPWVEFFMPDSPDLAGKTAYVNITLQVEYPQMSGTSTFNTRRTQMQHSVAVHLAPRGAGAAYDALWWGGLAGGGSICLGCSLLLRTLARQHARQSKPTQVAPA
jgi:hypothetical protein